MKKLSQKEQTYIVGGRSQIKLVERKKPKQTTTSTSSTDSKCKLV